MVSSAPMPEVLSELPDIRQSTVLPAGEQLWVECFAGEAGLTVAMVIAGLPSVQPWDIKFGQEFDVVQHGKTFLQLAKDGKMRHVHFGTPCQTLTHGCAGSARGKKIWSLRAICWLLSLSKSAKCCGQLVAHLALRTLQSHGFGFCHQ